MLNLVKQALKEGRLLEKGDSVVCALSGGADSVCLARVLCLLREEWEIRLYACHLNHLLRGAESFRDEAFVRGFCAQQNIPLYVRRMDAAKEAKLRRVGLEECARQLRYAFYDEALAHWGARRIATAHNADDNCETALFRMARGTGLDGLCGIPQSREDKIIRPLLFATREQIEGQLKIWGQAYVTDSSNFSDQYTRNRIRNKLMPSFREIHGNAVENMTRTLRLLDQDRDYLRKEAEKKFKKLVSNSTDGVSFNKEALLDLHPALRVRVLRLGYLAAGGGAGGLTQRQADSVETLLRSPFPSGRCSLPLGIQAVREYDTLRFCPALPDGVLQTRPLRLGETAELPESGLRIFCGAAQAYGVFNNSFNTFFPAYDKINFDTLCVRARKPGDRMAVSAHSGHRKLKDILIDRKIPRQKRSLIPVIADKDGVICVYGVGVNWDRISDTGDKIKIKFEDLTHGT